ncbi:MAG: M16 family metallopeptidase [Planctomycetota bacterium]
MSEALGVALEVALEPRLEGEGFPEDVFEQEQTNHLHFLRGLVDRRSAHAVHRARALTFAGERFANYEYGTLEGVAALTAKSMAGFHRTLLATGPVDILVTGAFDAERLADEIRERIPVFGARTPTPVTAPVPHPARRPAREVTEVQPGQQTVMVLGLRTNITTPNPKSVALLVLNGLLGGTSHSRLFNVVREREGLVYAISSSVEKLKGVMQIMAAFRPGRYERVRELVTQELASVVAGEFTAAEIDLAKRSLSRGTRQAADSAARTALRFYAGRLAGDGRTIPEALAAIEAVTRDDLVEAAGSLWLDLAYRLEPEAEAAES